MRYDDWFLTAAERGNPDTGQDRRTEGGESWSTGNQVAPLVHGATYFGRLLEVLTQTRAEDLVMFTDWRGDVDERLAGPGTEVAAVLCAAARRGVQVRGLVWRSHLDRFTFSEQENRHLGEEVNQAGGQVLLDQRVRRGGSHHQKLVVVRHAGGRDHDVAFAGGIDLCHSRRDDAEHAGDPQRQSMAAAYGDRPPWHDVQAEVHGPAVGDLELVFRERWDDPTPLDRAHLLRYLRDRLLGAKMHGDPLPPQLPDPRPCGPHAVQVLRTYGNRSPGYPFAPQGERSIARAYAKALRRARRLVYVEDQYLWSETVAGVFAAALRAQPGLHLVAVVPRFPDQDGAMSLTPSRVGRRRAWDLLHAAGPGRAAIYDLENPAGVPVYVHAKVCVVDDVWCSIGSDNLNRRSWTHDSELTCAVLDDTVDPREPADAAGLGDGARTFARDLRLQLWREHLGRAEGDDADLLDPDTGFAAFRQTATALADWHASGRTGRRPPGRVQPHRVDQAAAGPLWARLLYRWVYDPDGRPPGLRRRDAW